MSVLIISLYSCATEDKLLAVRLAGFKYHNFCFAEVDCELAQFTEAGQCIPCDFSSGWDSSTWLHGLKFAAILFFFQKASCTLSIVALSLQPADAVFAEVHLQRRPKMVQFHNLTLTLEALGSCGVVLPLEQKVQLS